MDIYVGNLSFKAAEEDIRAAFEAFGAVTSARVVMDKITGKSKGFAFVEMANEEEAKAAIAGLDGKEIQGRPVRVNEARPRTEGGERRRES